MVFTTEFWNKRREELSSKISKSLTGRKTSQEVKKKISKSHKGKIKTKKHLKNISLALKGRTYEDLHGKEKANLIKKKISKNSSLHNARYWLGKKRSKEDRKKMSEGAKGRKITEETRQKLRDCHKGEKAYQFNNYSSREPYGKEFSPELKEKIRKKYNYICQNCKKYQIKPNLVIHHINKNKKDNNIYNLIPLCRSCHATYHCIEAFKKRNGKASRRR